MSSSSTQRVGRAPKDRGIKGQYSPQSTKPPPDSSKAPDSLNPKNQPTAEQMRLAQITYDVNKSDDPNLQQKIEQVMELTGKTADTVIIALHDCDNETERAVDMLLEGDQNESEWEMSGKKKKNRQPTSQKQTEGSATTGNSNNKDKENRERGEKLRDNKREGGFRIRGPPRLNRGNGRNWRNKENEKNEKNLEENKRERTTEGRFRGSRRGSRGRGSGGRVRTFQNRGLSGASSTSSFPQSIDTWTNSTVEQTDSGGHVEGNMPVGNWSEFTVNEDWSEEDWNESLTETKVFTPSTGNQPVIEVNENSRTHLPQSIDLATLLQKPDPATTQGSLQPNGILQSHHSSSVSQSSSQSQFSLSQYAQQAAETIKAAVGITSSMNSTSTPAYSSSVFPSSDIDQSSVQLPGDLQPSLNSHTATQQVAVVASMAKTSSALPQRSKTQKPRLPPPSKIPESAVEMPDDAVMALDVQFGALEFGGDSSPFDFTNLSESGTGYQDSPLNSNTSHLNSQPVTGSHTGASNSTSMSNSLSSSLAKDAAYLLGMTNSSSSTSKSSIAKDMPPSSVSMGAQPSKVTTVPESILLGQQQDRKSVAGTAYSNQRTSSSTTIDGSYSAQKTSLLGAGSNSYVSQTPSLDSQSLLVSSGNQNSYMGSSQSHGLSTSTPYSIQQSPYVPQSASVTYPSQVAYTPQNNAYSYSAQQGYVGSGNNHSASMASSKLSGSISHGVESQAVSQHSYDSVTAAGLTSTLVTTPGSGNSVGLSSANMTGSSTLGLASTSSSTTTTSVLKNSLSASKTLPTMPPGVPPGPMMGHQYIMGQAGLPFYGLQQPLYSSYEEMQMLPSRLQPLGYYDLQFPSATSLTGRDPNLGSVAYTGDIKYSRADSDVSSVATTLSQGQAATQAHGQTFLNPAALHGYGYYFPGGVMPGVHPYGTPIFPVPAATNTHGASSSNQYQKTSFGSHSYCSGTGTATDLSNSIYSKAHTQLAKSFEKPGFHAGTPPPFNMAATQPTGPIGASSTPYGATPFIPVIAHSQHHSTMLHHHLQQDSSQQGTPSGGPQRGTQQSMAQQKASASSKQNFPYWNSN